ncbi:MAG: flagellar assembly protein FliW [Defluviitaleaceae bacterium]|nr:flagellar assembly protein FliW [Defluviitaleaceae bacterium]
MKLTTRHFGEIDVDESKIITFEEGLPGFEHLRQFVLFHNESAADDTEVTLHTSGVFLWLQSLDDGEVSFILLNTFLFMPGYSPELEEGALDSLGDFAEDDMIVRNIAVVPEKLENMTVNLCAPVVINAGTQMGKQVLATNKDYSVRHRIMQESRDVS